MRKALPALLLLVLALPVAACGNDDEETAGGGTTTTEASCDKAPSSSSLPASWRTIANAKSIDDLTARKLGAVVDLLLRRRRDRRAGPARADLLRAQGGAHPPVPPADRRGGASVRLEAVAGKRVLVVTTTVVDESELRKELADADQVHIVAPAAKVSRLAWLTGAEDDARAEADLAAQTAAEAVLGQASVEVDPTSQNTDAAQDVDDALRTFQPGTSSSPRRPPPRAVPDARRGRRTPRARRPAGPRDRTKPSRDRR